MTDEKLRWNELPVSVRRSKHLLYNYLAFGELPEMKESEEDNSSSETSTVNISVSVTDGVAAVGQVSVAIGSITGTTGNAGGCTLSNVPVGSATVTATKEGYEDYSEEVTIAADTDALSIVLLKKYAFVSYSDAEKTDEWGTGTVITTGVTSEDYSQVEVLTNSSDESFVGQKFYVVSAAQTDGTVYELFTDAGTTSAGIFVTISDIE